MNKTITLAALCGLLCGPAHAAGHDRQLEDWIKAHVAGKIGDIRGGVDASEPLVLVTAETLERAKDGPSLGFTSVDPTPTGSIRTN